MLIEKSRLPMAEILLVGLLPSFLKIGVYRFRGYKIGRRVSIGFGSVVIGKDVEIGEGVSIGFFTIIRGRQIKLGRYVQILSTSIIDTERIEILEDARINEQVFIGGLSTPESHLRVGARSLIMQMSFLNPAKPLFIGDDTVVGGHSLIFTHGSWQSVLDGYPVKFEPVTIGNNVYIPWRVFIMPGVTIGDGATIGANSLVNKDLPAGCLAVGSPAKILKTAEEYPARKSLAEQDGLMRTILQDFFQYLSYHGIELNVRQQESELSAKVTNSPSATLWYSTHAGNENVPAELNEQSVFIGGTRISDGARNQIKSKRAMWLDLKGRERCGSNNLGEETARFLSRYGLRFKRVD